MKTIHQSRNLTIDYDSSTQRYIVTVVFGEETVVGTSAGECPRCHASSHATLWELEGPGGDSNTIWLVCAADPPCHRDGKLLRWSVSVEFEDDWGDL